MRIFLTGVSCVGKTTIGMKLAKLLSVKFFDLDEEIETFFGTSIERLQNRFATTHSFRNEAAKALIHLMARPDSQNSVVALPPSGLMGGYRRHAVTRLREALLATAELYDIPEAIARQIEEAACALVTLVEDGR